MSKVIRNGSDSQTYDAMVSQATPTFNPRVDTLIELHAWLAQMYRLGHLKNDGRYQSTCSSIKALTLMYSWEPGQRWSCYAPTVEDFFKDPLRAARNWDKKNPDKKVGRTSSSYMSNLVWLVVEYLQRCAAGDAYDYSRLNASRKRGPKTEVIRQRLAAHIRKLYPPPEPKTEPLSRAAAKAPPKKQAPITRPVELDGKVFASVSLAVDRLHTPHLVSLLRALLQYSPTISCGELGRAASLAASDCYDYDHTRPAVGQVKAGAPASLCFDEL